MEKSVDEAFQTLREFVQQNRVDVYTYACEVSVDDGPVGRAVGDLLIALFEEGYSKS